MPSRETELVGLIVHELRTPISIAIGSLRQVGSLPDPAAQAALDRALRSCTRLERLAAELRDWSRVSEERPPVESQRLGDLLRDATAAASVGHTAEAAFHVADIPDLVVVSVRGLADALAALLAAVLRASAPAEAVRLGVETAGRTVILSIRRPTAAVADPGGTFDAELMGGMGFALPLSGALIDACGGRVASRRDGAGRLEAITVQMALADPAR